MALVLADRVRETSTTTGTVAVVLGGAYPSFQSFLVAVGNSNTTYYAISNLAAGEWEVGVGTYTSSGNTLSRDTVLSSSNSGSLVNFSAGSKDVICTQPSERAVYVNAANTQVSVPQLAATSITDSGNLTFTGTGNRITGDFSNATIASRAFFQTSTTNSSTSFGVIPNGTSTTAASFLYNNSDPTNASSLGSFALAAETRITSGITGTGTYLPMTFHTNGSERVRIDTSGNVGIGVTSTSGNKVAVGGSGLKTQFITTDANNAYLYTDGSAYIGSTGAFNTAFVTNNTERMRIDSSGNVGIGNTPSGTYKLEVTGAITTSSNLTFTGTGNRITGDMSNATHVNRVAFQSSTVNGATSPFFIPNGTGTVASVIVANASDPTNSSFGQIVANGSTDVRINSGILGTGTYLPMTFYTGGSERMRLDSSGNVGIGTSAPLSYALLNLQYNSGTINTALLATAYGVSPSTNFRCAGGTAASPSATTSAPINWVGGTSSDGTTFFNTVAFVGSIESTPTAGSHPTFVAFSTTPSGSTTRAERMRIDSSGNVGIGTSAPSVKLEVNGGITSYSTTTLPAILALSSQAAGFTPPNIQMRRTGASNTTTPDSQRLGEIRFDGLSVGTVYDNAAFIAVDSGVNASGGMPTVMTFGTATSGANAVERMRIDSSGNLLVGTTNTSLTAGVGVKFIASATEPYMAYVINSAGGSNFHLYNTNATNNGYRFYVTTNGGIANYSANNINLSDERTKTDIQNAGSYLAKICAIPVRTFKYKDQADDLLNLGVIAQEVESIAPELVDISGFGDTPEDGIPLKSIYQTDLQYALMKCIQEQQALITALTARITALEST